MYGSDSGGALGIPGPGWGPSRAPEPFFDIASLAMPRSIPAMLRWCEFLLNSQGVYGAAVNRVVSYFMTDVEVTGKDLGDDEQKDQKSYLVDQLQVMDHLKQERLDAACYGNSFRSVVESFTRAFACGSCRLEMTFDALDRYRGQTSWEWSSFTMNATCPHCGVRGPWRMHDRRAGGDGDLIVKRWSPHEIRIVHDRFSGRNSYIWAIPADYRLAITRGDFEELKRCPAEVIEAIKAGCDFKFEDDYLFHGRSMTFAGVNSRGWGIPKVLTNFRQAWNLQVLNRFNEAIAIDRVMPMQVVSPDGKAGAVAESVDPILGLDQGDASWRLQDMVSRHRTDPTSIHYWPFPIKMSNLGGDASQLAPFQLIDQALDTLLNALDTPVELYKMSLSSQDAPARLRLFEAVHREVPANANRFLAFLMLKVSQFKDWPKGDAKLLPVTLVDDLSKDQYKQFLLQAGLLSPQTATAMVNVDAKAEYRRILEFQAFCTEEQQKLQADLEAQGVQRQLAIPPVMGWMAAQQGAAGAGGAAPGGAAPAAGPGGQAGAPAMMNAGPQPGVVPQSPDEVLSRAGQIAQQLVTMPESQKNQALKNMKSQSPLLHDAVLAALDDVREDASRQGRDMVLGKQARATRGLLSAGPSWPAYL